MTALQASIGALNDIHDAPDDAGHKPGKPIPAGLVSVPAAWAVVVMGAALGIVLGHAGRCPGGGARGRGAAHRLRLRSRRQGDGLVVVAVRPRHPAAARVRLAGGHGRSPVLLHRPRSDDDAGRRCPRHRECPSRSRAGRGGAAPSRSRRGSASRGRGASTRSSGPWSSSWGWASWRSVVWDSPRSSRCSPRLASSGWRWRGHASPDRRVRERAWQFEAAGGGLALLAWLGAAAT